jgi:TRAP-type C4-dicarboxylate transport system permease small subunit
MSTVTKVVDKIVDGFVILLLASMVLVVFAQVFCRYVLLDSPPWTEEFSRFNFIWLSFMGAVAVFRRKAHLVIDTVVMILPEKVTRGLKIPVQLLISALLVVLIIKGTELVESGWLTRASTMDVPLSAIYLSVPLSAALMLFYQLADVLQVLARDRVEQ